MCDSQSGQLYRILHWGPNLYSLHEPGSSVFPELRLRQQNLVPVPLQLQQIHSFPPLESHALLAFPYHLPIWHQYSTLNSRAPKHSWQTYFAQPVQLFVCFKAKSFLWKCETNTTCPLAFFLRTSTSYEHNKAHPSSALTMGWGERSGVRVWRKSNVRGQKACW